MILSCCSTFSALLKRQFCVKCFAFKETIIVTQKAREVLKCVLDDLLCMFFRLQILNDLVLIFVRATSKGKAKMQCGSRGSILDSKTTLTSPQFSF